MSIHLNSATQLSNLLNQRQISAVEICQAIFDRIHQTEPGLSAFISLSQQQAMRQAELIDQKIASGQPVSSLAGIPVGVKDNICSKGIPTTCGSRMLEDFVPFYDATVVSKLWQAGALIVGKTNLDEFGIGSSTETSYFMKTRNPWDSNRSPGGSSGGSAVAVAACQIPLALGSDTGGSIRNPASYCGVLGLKPTYGAVSRYGLVEYAGSMEQIGPMARTTEDLKLLFETISGKDSRDATSCAPPEECLCFPGTAKLRIGLPKEYFESECDTEVAQIVYKIADFFKQYGAELIEVSLPSTRHASAAYLALSSAEAASSLGRYDGIRYGHAAKDTTELQDLYLKTRSEGFGLLVKHKILLGTWVLLWQNREEYHQTAVAMRQKIRQEFSEVFKQCDVLLTPSCPHTAEQLDPGNFANQKTLNDRYLIPANLAGIPALSMPAGFDSAGLPVGAQWIGPAYSEAMLIQTASVYEAAVGGFSAKEDLA